MFPIAFYLGPYPIYSYGLFVILGAIILFALAFAQARSAGRRQDHVVPMALGTLVGAFVGARLSHLLLEPDRALELLNFYSLFQPGVPGNIIYFPGKGQREIGEL